MYRVLKKVRQMLRWKQQNTPVKMFLGGTVVWHRHQATSGRGPTRSDRWPGSRHGLTGPDGDDGLRGTLSHVVSRTCPHESSCASPDEFSTRHDTTLQLCSRRGSRSPDPQRTPVFLRDKATGLTEESTSSHQLPTLPLNRKFCRSVVDSQ